jgi:hypothetical protein
VAGWLSAASGGVDDVADRPGLWLPAALGWIGTVGWIPLVAGVARPPTTAELTYAGQAIFSSGSWPWNAVALGVAAVGVLLVAVSLATYGDASLIRRLAGRPGPSLDQVEGAAAVQLLAVAPAVAVLIAASTSLVVIGPQEFNAPSGSLPPVVRVALRLWPYLVAAAVLLLAGSAWGAAAVRLSLATDRFGASAVAAPRRLLEAAPASAVQALAGPGVGVVYVVVATALLRVLWAPIEVQLRSGIDAAPLVLLVGFVAIWLCLVLGGGALRAWSCATWSRLLAAEPPSDRQPTTRERPTDR